ncbi:hypothetical protein BaRGS_00031074, partial [Batillaria attramentaria]
ARFTQHDHYSDTPDSKCQTFMVAQFLFDDQFGHSGMYGVPVCQFIRHEKHSPSTRILVRSRFLVFPFHLAICLVSLLFGVRRGSESRN